MSEAFNSQLKIPVWAVSIFAVLFIAYMGFFTAQVKGQNSTETKVIQIERQIERKADKEEINRIYTILDRIENKLDRQIEYR